MGKDKKNDAVEIDSPRCGICTHLLYQDQIGTGLCELKKMKPKDAYSTPCNKYEADVRIQAIIEDIKLGKYNEAVDFDE